MASGHTRLLTPADLYVYEYAWSPDSKTIAAIAAHGSGDNNWYIAQLYTVAVASGEMKSILKTSMQIAVPCWSPDGKAIAFIGGLMSDEGVIGGDIFTIAATGGAGTIFEYRVAAIMFSRLLRGAHIPVGIRLPLARVGLQQRINQLLREGAQRFFETPVPVWTWSLTEGMKCSDGPPAPQATEVGLPQLEALANSLEQSIPSTQFLPHMNLFWDGGEQANFSGHYLAAEALRYAQATTDAERLFEKVSKGHIGATSCLTYYEVEEALFRLLAQSAKGISRADTFLIPAARSITTQVQILVEIFHLSVLDLTSTTVRIQLQQLD